MGGTLIDYFYCSCPKKVTNSYVILLDISDDFPLYIRLKTFNLIKNNLYTKISWLVHNLYTICNLMSIYYYYSFLFLNYITQSFSKSYYISLSSDKF